MGLISKEIQNFGTDEIQKLEKEGKINLVIQEKEVTLTLEDVEITSQDLPGWLVASDKGITVALDITLNEALIEEGIAREMINRIQNIRKDSGLEVTDKIEVQILKNEVLEKAVLNNEEYIKVETLTKTIKFVEKIENGIEIEFDNIISKIALTK